MRELGKVYKFNEKSAVLNPRMLLSLTDSNASMITALLAAFASSTQERLENIAKAVAANDSENIVFESHSIKGAAASIGAERLQELAAEIELSGKKKSADALHEYILLLNKEFECLLRTIEEK